MSYLRQITRLNYHSTDGFLAMVTDPLKTNKMSLFFKVATEPVPGIQQTDR